MQKLPAERHASYGTNPGAMLLLLALSILLSGATLGIFARRDVGGR